MAPVRFELTMSAGELPQTYALDLAATGTGCHYNLVPILGMRGVVLPLPKQSLTEGRGDSHYAFTNIIMCVADTCCCKLYLT